MKTTITFKEEDNPLMLKQLAKASDMANALFTIKFNLYKKIVWDIERNNISPEEAVSLVFKNINEVLIDNDICIEDLTI